MSFIIPSRRGSKITTSLSGDGSYPVPNGTLVDTIELLPSANMVGVQIGTTPGGEEIMPATDLLGGETSLIGSLIKGPATLYFTNVTAAMQIFLYKK